MSVFPSELMRATPVATLPKCTVLCIISSHLRKERFTSTGVVGRTRVCPLLNRRPRVDLPDCLSEDINMSVETILIIVLVVFLLGGGGWYWGRGRA